MTQHFCVYTRALLPAKRFFSTQSEKSLDRRRSSGFCFYIVCRVPSLTFSFFYTARFFRRPRCFVWRVDRSRIICRSTRLKRQDNSSVSLDAGIRFHVYSISQFTGLPYLFLIVCLLLISTGSTGRSSEKSVRARDSPYARNANIDWLPLAARSHPSHETSIVLFALITSIIWEGKNRSGKVTDLR